jgi:hypothetical protein
MGYTSLGDNGREPRFERHGEPLPRGQLLGRASLATTETSAPSGLRRPGETRGVGHVASLPPSRAGQRTWMVTAAAAFSRARNRQFQRNREWIVRSYAVIFTVVGTWVRQPIPD